MLLVVRHGRHRGPRVRFRGYRPEKYDSLFGWIRRNHPETHVRLKFWATGDPKPAGLGGIRAVFFFLQDPLLERFPDCFAEAAELAGRAREQGIRLVNPPEALSHSIKSIQSRLWADAGIPTPAHLGFTDRTGLLAVMQQVTYPAILRADRLHTQAGMRFISCASDVLAIPEAQISYPGTITPFEDTRAGYSVTAAGTPWSQLYHKKRVMVFGDHAQNNHLFFGPGPIVSSSTCSFGYYRSLNPLRRLRGRLACRPHLALDYDFFCAQPEQPDLFHRAARALNLNWIAIDYSTRADGTVVLWEANPYFAIGGWPWPILPGPRRLAGRHDTLNATAYRFMKDALTT